jgi:hypothetical protein
MKPKTEKQIENEILDYLNKEVGFFFKHQSMGVYDANILRYRKKSAFDLNGVADILGVVTKDRLGRFVAIEVKKEGQKLRMNQVGFIEKVLTMRGVAFMATSVEDTKKQLLKYGLIK